MGKKETIKSNNKMTFSEISIDFVIATVGLVFTALNHDTTHGKITFALLVISILARIVQSIVITYRHLNMPKKDENDRDSKHKDSGSV